MARPSVNYFEIDKICDDVSVWMDWVELIAVLCYLANHPQFGHRIHLQSQTE